MYGTYWVEALDIAVVDVMKTRGVLERRSDGRTHLRGKLFAACECLR
jgi:hypothetical protein